MNILAFIAYSVVVTFTPGPSNIMIFSTAQNHGTKKALEFVAGATLAFGMLLALSATANSILFNFIPGIKLAMEIVGAIYMLYLAYKIFNMDIGDETSSTGGFKTGFIMQFINPKVVLFTLTVIANFVIPFYKNPLDIAFFVVILTAIGCCAYSSWVILGSLFRRYMQPYQKQANILLSLIMIYCAYTISGLQTIL